MCRAPTGAWFRVSQRTLAIHSLFLRATPRAQHLLRFFTVLAHFLRAALRSPHGCGPALFAASSDQLLIVPVTPLPEPAPTSVTAVDVADGMPLW